MELASSPTTGELVRASANELKYNFALVANKHLRQSRALKNINEKKFLCTAHYACSLSCK